MPSKNFFFTLLSAVIVLDQVTKAFFVQFFNNKSIILLPNILSLQTVENSGIAFSISLPPIILKWLTVVLIIAIFYYFFTQEKHAKEKLTQIAYAGILGGAISNGIERIFFGKVIDFINLRHFAVFNVGDIAISLGVIILFYVYYYDGRKI